MFNFYNIIFIFIIKAAYSVYDKNFLDVLELLIQAGADVNHQDNNGDAALMWGNISNFKPNISFTNILPNVNSKR